MFMHGGFWHIFFNMYTLLMFGTVVERTIGTRNFIIFYFVTGLGAMALHTGVEYLQASHYIAAGTPAAQVSLSQLYRTPMLGASGAIYGLLVAYAMLFPDARMTLLFPPVTLDAKWMVIIFIAIELLTGVTGTQMGVAHFAHLGGALLGFLLIYFWRKSGKLWRR
jgi:membrane associated rhomboid family serine protease